MTFRQSERLTQQFFRAEGTVSRPAVMPMDAYPTGDELVLGFDLPGVSPESSVRLRGRTAAGRAKS